MLVKERVKFSKVDEMGKKRNVCIVVSGRSIEELQGRIDQLIARRLMLGYTLR